MNIGLIDVDSHAKIKQWGQTVYPNLALCKISAYHKSIGDSVEWVDPLFGDYDIVYMSKIFSFSPDYEFQFKAKQIIKGGTGYDIHSSLPEHIDKAQPDYSIYPTVSPDTSFGFLTRGCPNKCPWCVVPKKEGDIRPYMDIDIVANGNKNVVLMDNNILAAGDYAVEQLRKIIDRKYVVDFNQALDARLVNEEFAQLLAKVRWIKRLMRFGCDTTNQIKHCERAIKMITDAGYMGEFMLYAILTDNFSESYNRVMYWRERLMKARQEHTRKVYVYVQPYKDPNGINVPPQWQKDMARWCNNKSLFCSHTFEEYEPRKGFKCKFYVEQLYGKQQTST